MCVHTRAECYVVEGEKRAFSLFCAIKFIRTSAHPRWTSYIIPGGLAELWGPIVIVSKLAAHSYTQWVGENIEYTQKVKREGNSTIILLILLNLNYLSVYSARKCGFFPFSSFRCFSRFFFFKNSRVNIYSISIFIIQNNHPYPEHTIHFEFFYIELHDEHHMILLGRLHRPSTPRFTSCGTCAGFFVDD